MTMTPDVQSHKIPESEKNAFVKGWSIPVYPACTHGTETQVASVRHENNCQYRIPMTAESIENS